MPFVLDQVVPWGRSFDEYVRMFALTDADLNRSILGCADGPAAFNAELTKSAKDKGTPVVVRHSCYATEVDEDAVVTHELRAGMSVVIIGRSGRSCCVRWNEGGSAVEGWIGIGNLRFLQRR